MNTGNVMIEGLGVALPSTFRSATDLVAGCRVPIDFNMEAITGIRETPTLAEGEYARDMAERAILDCLRCSKRTPSDVELLVGCTLVNCNRPGAIELEPTLAQEMQRRFGFTRALTLDVSAACAGLFVGLCIAEAFLKSRTVRSALIFTGEYVTHAVATAQREIESAMDPRLPCLTIGDSGAALMLELGDDPNRGLLDLQLYTLGRYSGHCVAKPTDRAPGGLVMNTNTVRLALITSREGKNHFDRVQRTRPWLPTEFDFFVPHQASAATLGGVVRDANRRLGAGTLRDDNVINNLARRGNTVTTTHFMAIHDAIRDRRIQNGHRLLLSTVASGATIGSAAYHLDDLPERMLRAGHEGCDSPGQADVIDWRRSLARPVKLEAIGFAEAKAGVAADSISLAKAAARVCLSRSGLKRNDMELLIFAGVYRSEFILEPAIAAFLAGEMRINDSSREGDVRTLAFDLNDSSNGFLSACQIAARAIESGQVRAAMVVVAEGDVPMSAGSPPFSPSACAAVLTASADGTGFTDFGCYGFPGEHEALRSDIVVRAEGGAELQRVVQPDLDAISTRCIHRAITMFLAERADVEPFDFLILPDVMPELERAARDSFQLARDARVLVANHDEDRFTSALGYELERLCASGTPAGKRALLVSAGAGVKVVCAAYQF